MTAKVFVVTGGTSGIGKAIAMELATLGETVVIVARDVDRGNAVLQELERNTGNKNIDLQLCDLSNMSSVNNLASVVKLKYNTINVLINNAAVYKRRRETTVEGYEKMFATNHLGPFLLTNLLLEALIASGSGHILNVTAPSTVQLDFDDLQGERKFNSLSTFGATKMANLLFTFALARRLEGSNITANAIHPGLARSQLMKEAFAPLRLFTWLLSSSPQQAAHDVIRAVTAPEFEKVNGSFLYRGKEIEAPVYAHDLEVQQRLWETSERLTDITRLPSIQ